MANSITEIMKSFETSIVKNGLPEPPRLSKLFFPEEGGSTSEEVDLDRLEITPQTKPGWYTVGGKKFYLSEADIPGRPPYIAGSLRGTL